MVIVLDKQKQFILSEDETKSCGPPDGQQLAQDKDGRVNGNTTIGGQNSAFSGLVRAHERSNMHFMREIRDDFIFKPPFHSQYLPLKLYGGHGEFPMDLPIAPAFAQILQRRRRRENRPRRQRTTFTSDQTLKLELEYNRADYITRPRRFELADTLNLTESQIKIWFQNRRAKDKRIEKAQMDHQLRSIGYPSFVGTTQSSAPHQSTCGVCAVPVPLPLPLRPISWTSVNT